MCKLQLMKNRSLEADATVLRSAATSSIIMGEVEVAGSSSAGIPALAAGSSTDSLTAPQRTRKHSRSTACVCQLVCVSHQFHGCVPCWATIARTGEESDPEVETDCLENWCYDFDDEDDEYDVWTIRNKRTSSSCSKTGKRRKGTQQQLIRAHTQKKINKREGLVEQNSVQRKENVRQQLEKKGLKLFGYSLYERRAVQSNKANSSRCRHHPTTAASAALQKFVLDKRSCSTGYSESVKQLIDLQHRDLTPEDYNLLLTLDDSVAPKALSQAQVDSIESTTAGSLGIEGELCAICIGTYSATKLVKTLPCQHTFHAACIDKWLSVASQNCPLDGLSLEL